MNNTLTTPTPVRPAPNDPDIAHMVCCRDRDVSLCGLDVSAEPWDPNNPNDCVLCVAMCNQGLCPLNRFCPEDD